MLLIPFALRAALSTDRDLRRLRWLLQCDKLAETHRAALSLIEQRVVSKMFGAWALPGDRETIRVLFNVYRGARVRIR